MEGNNGIIRARSSLTWINLTYQCDMLCSWCYASSANGGHFMDEDIFEKIVSFLHERGSYRVVLSGGEPTSHPHFLSFIDRCRQNFFRVMLNTSGLAFADSDFSRQAIDNGLSFINLSLKAVNAKDFYVNTGVDGFDRQAVAVRNILSDSRPTLVVNLTLNRYFMANFDRAVELLLRWGVKSVAFDLARPIYGQDPFGGGQIPTEDEAVEFVAGCFSKIRATDLDYTFRLDIPLCRFVGSEFSKRLSQINFMTNCFLRDGNALIFDPRGSVIPCNILTETVLGRIGQDFSTAGEYEKFLRREDVAATLKSLRIEDKPSCQSCSLSGKCCRGCAAFKLHNSHSKSLLVEAIAG